MDVVPPLRFGLLNGWLLLIAYFAGLIISVLAFPPDKRKKLFAEPQYPIGHARWIIILVGRVAAITFITLTFFTELRLGSTLFYVGLVVYAIGYIVVMVALDDYKHVPVDEVATGGLYRYSRNPQWLGLVMVFIGTALAVGGWLHLGQVLIAVITYHFQILLEEDVCTSIYGERYRDYMNRVPRYLLV